jgi:hypothetical protein
MQKESPNIPKVAFPLLLAALGAVALAVPVWTAVTDLMEKPAPSEIAEARKTVKRLKSGAWDVQTCIEYQRAGYKVCKYDRETGYADDGSYDSIGNRMTRGCDEWLDRVENYCPKCTSPGRCDEPFE